MWRFRNKLFTGLLLLLITIAFFWKLTLTRQYTWLDQPDIVYQVVPWLQMETVQWHAKTFPLWDPHVWAGQPIVGQIQPGALNPLNWVLFSLHLGHQGLISTVALNWYWALIHFFAVLFCYWFCRDVGLSRSASVFGGCTFGLGGFMGAIGWPQFMMSALLLPLIMMLFLRLLRGENQLANGAGSGALLGASFLGGHHNVPIFLTLLMLVMWIYLFCITPKPTLPRVIVPAA